MKIRGVITGLVMLGVLCGSAAHAQMVGAGASGGYAPPPPPIFNNNSTDDMVDVNSLPGLDMPPVIPGVMSESRYKALRKLFEDKDAEVQRGALCQFVSTQRIREDSHNLSLIKTFTRLVEKTQPSDGKMQPETTYACALEALTTTIMTHGTFRESSRYKNSHFGTLGSPSFLHEHLVPIYLPIMKDTKHKLHTESYYVFMTLGDVIAKDVLPTLVEQLNAIEAYTYATQKEVETIIRTLNVMGKASEAAAPKMLELLIKDSEVDYEGNFGYDGKRGFNAEVISSLVSIVGYEKKYQRVLLKAINRAIEQDEVYWSDKIRPQARYGSTDLTLSMTQARDKMLKIMGLEAVQEMKDLF